MKAVLCGGAFVLLLCAGCGSADQGSNQSATGSSGGEEKTVKVTSVSLLPGGGSTTKITWITPAQDAAMTAHRQAMASGNKNEIANTAIGATITEDTGCGDNTIWLYDALDGGGNRVCLTGSGYSGVCTWFSGCYYYSYWPGNDGGYAYAGDIDYQFSAWGALTNIYGGSAIQLN